MRTIAAPEERSAAAGPPHRRRGAEDRWRVPPPPPRAEQGGLAGWSPRRASEVLGALLILAALAVALNRGVNWAEQVLIPGKPRAFS